MTAVLAEVLAASADEDQLEAEQTNPGWYMLFLTDSKGIPSLAHWVHLTQP